MVPSTSLQFQYEEHKVAFLPNGSETFTALSYACHLQDGARPLEL